MAGSNHRRGRRRREAFTVVEFMLISAVVALLAGILIPQVLRYLGESKVSKAHADTKLLATTIMKLYADTGKFPFTDSQGPAAAPGIDRLVSDAEHVPSGAGPGAAAGAANWGTLGRAKSLADYICYNNPDDDTGPEGQNEPGCDYPTSGFLAWRGPYYSRPVLQDPWGHSYVINARYFPGNPRYGGTSIHTVLVLSAGPDGLQQTPFDDALSHEQPAGDDVGYAITMSGK